MNFCPVLLARSRAVETAEAVQALRQREITPLKRGVNERATIQGQATYELSGLGVFGRGLTGAEASQFNGG